MSHPYPPSPENRSSTELPRDRTQPVSNIKHRSPPPSPSPCPSDAVRSDSPKREDWEWEDDERGWQGGAMDDSTPTIGPRRQSTKESTKSSEAWRLPTLSPPPQST
jgi:hypothetical protein